MELEERAGVRVRSDLILDTLNIYNEDCVLRLCVVLYNLMIRTHME